MKKNRSTAKLQVGLIGCGHIAQIVHLNILSHLPGAELVALADTDPGRRIEAGRRVPQAMVVADYHELLAMPHVEAVVICLPSGNHAEAATAAFTANKHVYLEKPLATNLEDGRKVLEAWKRARHVGMIGFNYRFNALYGAMKEHIRKETIAPLVSAQSVFSSVVHPLPSWKQMRLTGGGVLLDLASHHIDLVRFLFEQDISDVFASHRSQRGEGDSATLQLRLTDGLLVQSFFSSGAVEEDTFTIYGQAGILAVDRYRSFMVDVSEPRRPRFGWRRQLRKLWAVRRSPYLFSKMLASSKEPSYCAALAHFVTAVRTNQPVRPDFWDGYCSLAVVAAAEESARTGRMIPVADVEKGGSK